MLYELWWITIHCLTTVMLQSCSSTGKAISMLHVYRTRGDLISVRVAYVWTCTEVDYGSKNSHPLTTEHSTGPFSYMPQALNVCVAVALMWNWLSDQMKRCNTLLLRRPAAFTSGSLVNRAILVAAISLSFT